MEIYITSLASVSALGDCTAQLFNYERQAHGLELLGGTHVPIWSGALSRVLRHEIEQTLAQYSRTDPRVLFAIWTATKAVRGAGWEEGLDSALKPLEEKPKWSRPAHQIER
jgi:hypothetical protein